MAKNSEAKKYKRKAADALSPHFDSGELEALVREADHVRQYAEALSAYQKEPVIVIGSQRTGAPYTWRIPDWKEQAKAQLSGEEFERFWTAFRKERLKTRNELLAAHNVTEEWIRAGSLKSIIFVRNMPIRSAGGQRFEHWDKFRERHKRLFAKSPAAIVVDSSKLFGDKARPSSLFHMQQHVRETIPGIEKRIGFIESGGIEGAIRNIRAHPTRKIVFLNPSMAEHYGKHAWHDDRADLLGMPSHLENRARHIIAIDMFRRAVKKGAARRKR